MSHPVQPISVRLAGGPGRSYDVHVGTGLWPALARFLAERPIGDRYVLITDSHVSSLHAPSLLEELRRAGLDVLPLEFPAGEAHKTRDTRALLEDRMVEAGIGRDGAVLALGGGVVGDLAGFVAATYHRGIPYIQIPTTLLAMVDASIGGKTGHDLPAGKNLVGAFHHPAAVHVDLSTLSTLPAVRLREGFAEAIKHGLVADAGLVDELQARRESLLALDPDALLSAVTSSIRIKAERVSRDPLEAGERAVLNLGHTVGHALEAVSAYRMSHGEAVSRGIVVEAELSARAAVLAPQEVERIRGLLRAFGLPVGIPRDLPPEMLVSACRRDKKVRGGTIRYVRLASIGTVARDGDDWTFAVEPEEMEAALRRAREGS